MGHLPWWADALFYAVAYSPLWVPVAVGALALWAWLRRRK